MHHYGHVLDVSLVMPAACRAPQAEVRTLERVSDRIKDCVRDLDARATHISQTATRVGDRLQV